MLTIENDNEIFTSKREEIKRLLAFHGIDVSDYGKGEAKTLDHLTREVIDGEAALTVNENGELRRDIRIVAIHVLHQDSVGNWWELYESAQEFKDGRKRIRELPQSLSEKLVGDESTDDAVLRALEEELDIHDPLVASYELGESALSRISQSYPGLMTCTKINEYVAVLNSDSVKEAYKEAQADKTTTWLWRQAK